jgi:hypothetical protein
VSTGRTHQTTEAGPSGAEADGRPEGAEELVVEAVEAVVAVPEDGGARVTERIRTKHVVDVIVLCASK